MEELVVFWRRQKVDRMTLDRQGQGLCVVEGNISKRRTVRFFQINNLDDSCIQAFPGSPAGGVLGSCMLGAWAAEWGVRSNEIPRKFCETSLRNRITLFRMYPFPLLPLPKHSVLGVLACSFKFPRPFEILLNLFRQD